MSHASLVPSLIGARPRLADGIVARYGDVLAPVALQALDVLAGLSGSDKTPIGVRRQFSSIELLSLLDGRCSPPSSLEYAPSGAQSKQEGG